MSDIFYMKMMNGEDIVSTILNEDEECFYITFPLKFIYSKNNRNNSISIAIIPWVPFEEIMNSNFQIYKNNIATVVPVSEKLKYIYQSKIEDSQEGESIKAQELYDKLNSDPKLNELFMANTSNNWIN